MPISCCNVINKIISKILATRMTSVMPSFMDLAQAGFFKGRFMMENIFLVQELIREYMKKRTTPKCMLKVDIRKAFDSISWSFLKDILLGLGFIAVFIG